MKIKKGDTVKVLYGKEAGKQGVVISVLRKANKVVIDGINVFKKAVKGDGKTRKSEFVNVVRPMSVSKTMVVCPNCKKATRVAMQKEGENFVRVCSKCKKSLDVKKTVEKAEEKVEKKAVEKKTAKKTTKVKKSTK